MFGRTTTLVFRIPAPTRLTSRATQSLLSSSRHATTLIVRRAYSTPGRPKKAVGEASRPIKRTVKKTASTRSASSEAGNKTTATKQAAAPKKKKAKAVKKKAVLTEEQVAAKKEKLLKAKANKKTNAEKQKLVDLKKAALTPPHKPRRNAYLVFASERSKASLTSLKGKSLGEIRGQLASVAKENAAEWKNLGPSDIEHYNHIANVERREAEAAYKSWVESHSPEEILAANRARSSLRRKETKDGNVKKGSATKWPAIVDERAVKRPLTSFAQYSLDRRASGDFKHISLPETSRLLGQEWRALNQQEKDKYNRMHEREVSEYTAQYQNVYGYAPTQQAAAAAA